MTTLFLLLSISDFFAHIPTLFNSMDPIYIYLLVMGLMTLESSIFPVPSELVVPPAAMLAVTNPDIRLIMIFVAATIGCMLGAYANYFVSKSLGRIVIYKLADTRLAQFFLINSEKIQKAEVYFNKKGNISTFIGRLIPVVRHLISIPAGLSKMNFGYFSLYTFLGGGLWNVILILIGYSFSRYIDLGLFHKYIHEISIGIIILGFLFLAYLIYNVLRKKKSKEKED